jgi:hypothetical protein
VAGIYQRHDWKAEKREALNLWNDHVAAILERRAEGESTIDFNMRTSASTVRHQCDTRLLAQLVPLQA